MKIFFYLILTLFSLRALASDDSEIVNISFMNKKIGSGIIVDKGRILTACHVEKELLGKGNSTKNWMKVQ